jgi:predicted glycosyltransferase
MMTPDLRILTYSHDGYGLGHFRRNSRLIKSLLAELPDGRVLMVTSSPASPRFELPAQVDYVKLPSLSKVANDNYVSARLGLDRDQVASLRSALVAAAVEEFEPDLMLVDFYPLGVNGELREALARVRTRHPSIPVVLGWRDILDQPDQVRREWGDTGQIDAIDQLFDKVLIYGCQDVYDPISEYHLPAAIAARTTFTGYLLDQRLPRPVAHSSDAPRAVCTLGGGEDGRAVAWAFLEAMSDLGPQGWLGTLVTGPLMPAHDFRGLAEAAAQQGVACVPFVEDMWALLEGADVVVAMAGYNTVCEVLAVGVPTVVIPRTHPRQEQMLRATQLAKRGLVRLALPEALSGDRLAALVREQATVGRDELRARVGASLDTDGLRTAAQVLARCVGRPVSLSA